MFNLEDAKELIHYGQSLSKFDDFNDGGILGDEDEEDKTMNNRVIPKHSSLRVGQIDAAAVRMVHFGGFNDEDEDEDEDDNNGV